MCLSLSRSLTLSIHIFLTRSIDPSICVSVSASIGVFLFICIPVSVYLHVPLSICIHVHVCLSLLLYQSLSPPLRTVCVSVSSFFLFPFLPICVPSCSLALFLLSFSRSPYLGVSGSLFISLFFSLVLQIRTLPLYAPDQPISSVCVYAASSVLPQAIFV